MSTEHIALDLIDDNPYNPRQEYPQARVKEMALSLQNHGQLETPQARRVDGRVQIASGHLRLRALRLNHKKEPGNWTSMHLDVVNILDDDMFLYAVEENLKRHELTPLELAQAIDSFCKMSPLFTETELAKQLGFTLGHVSNMRRVLRLPASLLARINEGKISFTQGRELLVMEPLLEAEEKMKEACRGLQTEGRGYGEPNTVAGMQKSIFSVVLASCNALDKRWEGWRTNLLFKSADCDKCEHVINVVPQKGKTARFCTDSECWEKHQEDHRQAAAAEAIDRMTDEVLKKAAEQEEEPVDPEALRQGIAAAPAAEQTLSQEKDPGTKLRAKMLADMEDEYPCKHCPKNADCNFYHVTLDGHKKYQCPERDKPAEEPAATGEEVIVDAAMFEKVHASSSADKIADKDSSVRRPFSYEGKKYISTGGVCDRIAGTSHDECYQLVPIEEYSGETRTYRIPLGYKGDYHEDRRNDPLGFYNGMLVSKGTKVLQGPMVFFRLAAEGPEEPAQEKPPEIPEEVMARAREKAGTRAEVLDLAKVTSGSPWSPQFQQGYASLSRIETIVDDPEECTEKCTTGFHFAFDPRDREPQSYIVCSNMDCLKKKKAQRTKRLNADGNARKTRERQGIRAAVAATTALHHGGMKLILHTQFSGYHIASYYGGAKQPVTWLWDKVSPGIKSGDRTPEKLWKAIDKLSEEALAKLIVEFCFYALTDHGDGGNYKIKTEDQLYWLGVSLGKEEKGEKGPDATSARRRGKAKAAAGETPTAAQEN